MGTRTWAAFGNILRIFAIPLALGSVVSAYRAIELVQHHAPTQLVLMAAGVSFVGIVMTLLFWLAKGPLIGGNFIVRGLVGLYMLLWVISTLGFALIIILIVYLFTSEPEDAGNGFFRDSNPEKPRFAPPQNWHATGRVGPSGATIYSNADQEQYVGIFDSWLPVQVLDKRNGLANVVAATGERGWVDSRTLTEGA